MFDKRAPDPRSGPVPPLGLLDVPSTMKFWEMARQQFQEAGWDPAPLLDWMIRTLLTSLAADSAARIFLPKTETAPFVLDDLLPFSAVAPTGRARISLSRAYLLSPAWNNRDLAEALHRARAMPEEELLGSGTIGVYLRELNLAILDASVHEALACRSLGRGEALLDTYSLRDLAPAIATDGTDWLVTEEDGSETYCPVLEPRMAALYRLAVERYCPDLLPREEPEG